MTEEDLSAHLDAPKSDPKSLPNESKSAPNAAAPVKPKAPSRGVPVKFLALAAVLIVVGAAVAYEVETSYSSSPTINQCAGVATGPTSISAPHGGLPAKVPGPEGTAARAPASQVTASDAARTSAGRLTHGNGPVIKIVAAENFWGSLVSQLGGNQTTVLSIITDPNADPHEYEANASDAAAIASAQFVIVNGVGYDDWALQMIAAGNNPNQVVLNVGTMTGANVNGGIVSGNPHQWYNPVYVNDTLAWMYGDLVKIQPGSTTYFQQNWDLMNTTGQLGGVSLDSLYGRANWIRNEFAGTEVASTESIFVYLANFTDLDLVSPPAFMEAIAEGNDPPAASVVQFECQLESGNVKVLVYNVQTITPVTTQVKSIAAAHNVTIIGVSETIQPPGVPFQLWMYGEYLSLQNALNANELGV
jgi:zinc/manganese transport system substrate-binding protein